MSKKALPKKLADIADIARRTYTEMHVYVCAYICIQIDVDQGCAALASDRTLKARTQRHATQFEPNSRSYTINIPSTTDFGSLNVQTPNLKPKPQNQCRKSLGTETPQRGPAPSETLPVAQRCPGIPWLTGFAQGS